MKWDNYKIRYRGPDGFARRIPDTKTSSDTDGGGFAPAAKDPLHVFLWPEGKKVHVLRIQPVPLWLSAAACFLFLPLTRKVSVLFRILEKSCSGSRRGVTNAGKGLPRPALCRGV